MKILKYWLEIFFFLKKIPQTINKQNQSQNLNPESVDTHFFFGSPCSICNLSSLIRIRTRAPFSGRAEF